jgi:MoaA/NifB/PqqE/SkfB family radical SAM enzyme
MTQEKKDEQQTLLPKYAYTRNEDTSNYLGKMELKTPQEIYERLKFFPNQVLLETSSYCNLDCSMCARQFDPRDWGKMDEAMAFNVIDEVVDRAPWAKIWFCYFGEPLVSKKLGLYKRIKYAKDKGLGCASINTNGTLLDEQAMKDLLDAGLDEVYVGLDAITKETYEKIRRGATFEPVMENVHRAIKMAGNDMNITVQFAELDENKHEIDDFIKYWKDFGVQIYIRPKVTWLNSLDDEIQSGHDKRHACAWMFDSININENGNIPYCICDWEGRVIHGNVGQESIFDIWQKKIFPFLEMHARGEWSNLPKFCQDCPDWQTKEPRNMKVISLVADRSNKK